MTPDDLPQTWDERATLLTMLQYTRDVAMGKVRELADDHVGAAPLPGSPLMTLGGVVNHLRWVEHSWVENRFVGGPDLGPWTTQEPDREFSLGATTPLDQTLEEYASQAARTDAIVAGLKTEIAKMKVGPGNDPKNDMGPLVTKQHFEKVRGYVDQGVKEGATLVVDGRGLKVPGHEDGYFLGSYVINIGVTELGAVGIVIWLMIATSLSVLQLQIIGVVLAIGLPIAFYPVAVCLWMVLDLLVHPPGKASGRPRA